MSIWVQKKIRLSIRNIVYFALVACSLTIVPNYLVEPFNFPKAIMLWGSAFVGLGYLLPNLRVLLSKNRKIFYLYLLLISSFIFVFIFHSGPIWNELYGIFGRDTGLLTYISLFIISMCCTLSVDENMILRIKKILIIVSTIIILYSILQFLNRDMFNWKLQDKVVGTFGNTNFLSAFLGISMLFIFSQILENSRNQKNRIIQSLLLISGIYVVSISGSSQGLFGLALGSSIIVYNRFIRYKYSLIIKRFLLINSVLIGFLVGLGIFKIGPLSFLYQESTTFRSDYWRAGISMFINNPIAGVGLDSYGDNYTMYRDELAATRRSPSIVADAAHNVYIDILACGGLIIFIPYLIMFALTTKSVIQMLRNSPKYDSNIVVLTSAWFVYATLCLVGINQISFAVLGWIINGLILGIKFSEKASDKSMTINRWYSKNHIKEMKVTPQVYLVLPLVSFIFLLTLALPALYTNFKVVATAKNGDMDGLMRILETTPRSPFLLVDASRFFLNRGEFQKSLELSSKAIALNPKELNAWRLYLANPLLSEMQREFAQSTAIKLDPYNFEFKLNSMNKVP